jgi:DNA-binding transcriptional MerR regulator
MQFPAQYSIKDLERLSGIKAHTIRIWEKRYDLIKPDRTDTNIRFYSNDDLKRLLNISLLNKNGIKISNIALMSEKEVAEKIAAFSMVKTTEEDVIETLILALIDLSESLFDKVFTSSILKLGFENTMLNVIFPFLKRIGVMWQTGSINPAQEHFISNIIRQKIIVATDGIRQNDFKPNKTALLFLPENELHEINLLFYNYALKVRNIKTIYLGQSVPFDSLSRVVEIIKPDILLTVLSNGISKKNLIEFLNQLSLLAGKKKTFISGFPVVNFKNTLPATLLLFKDHSELIRQI